MTMHVHLNGSVALDTAEEVFATVGQLLGPHLLRIPDGEPGGRRVWVLWQAPLLRAHPLLQAPPPPPQALSPVKLVEGATPDELHFGELGYAREARASYLDFLAARQRGDLPAHVRFQVSLPTARAVIGVFAEPASFNDIFPAYERAMVREVERLCAAIPHQDLAIQWDVCPEMVTWDGRWVRKPYPGMEAVLTREFGVLADAVPNDVEMGYHLCYGDLDGKHMIEPEDAGKMVEMANFITSVVERPIAYVTLPVPVNRSDDAYYQPLTGLKLRPETEAFLGVVHAADGVEGTKRRMAVARKYLPAFGLTTECGISRGRSPSLALDFLHTYAGAAKD